MILSAVSPSSFQICNAIVPMQKDARMLPGVRLWGERQFSLLER